MVWAAASEEKEGEEEAGRGFKKWYMDVRGCVGCVLLEYDVSHDKLNEQLSELDKQNSRILPSNTHELTIQ